MRREPFGAHVEGRREHEDVRVRCPLQMRQAGLRAQKSSARVDSHHQVVALHRRLQRAGEADRAGVVDQDVDAAEVR